MGDAGEVEATTPIAEPSKCDSHACGPSKLQRQQSEALLKTAHKHLYRMPSTSDVTMLFSVAIGVALQMALYALPAITQSKSSVLHLLSLRWLLPASAGGWLGACISGGVMAAALWVWTVQFLLPIWRLHLRRRSVWPLSCEEIRLSDHADKWPLWAQQIDLNLTDATLEEDWGGMGGEQALKLAAAYQDDFAPVAKGQVAGPQQQQQKFVCLRYFPTPPPKRHTSWFAYFRSQKEQQKQPALAQQPATPSVAASPIPPYADLAALRTPGGPLLTAVAAAAGATPAASPSATTPRYEAPPALPLPSDDTMALVFLTVLPEYDLQTHLPRPVAKALGFFVGCYRRIVGTTDAHTQQVNTNEGGDQEHPAPARPTITMSMGIIGYQFPFRSGIFFTRPLAHFDAFTGAFRTDKKRRLITWPLATAASNSKEYHRKAARSALVLQVLTDWNLARSASDRVDLLLQVVAASSSVAVASRLVGMLPIPVPPSYMVDLRSWRGSNATWDDYAEHLLDSQGTTVHEEPFERSGGTVAFDNDLEQAPTVVSMFAHVAKKQAESNQPSTLLQPTKTFIRSILGRGYYNKEHTFVPLAQVLQLRLRGDLVAQSVVSSFGPGLVTSDMAGFNYDLLAKCKHANLYSIKLKHVISLALKQQAAFIDFGPTTGAAKLQVGCQEIPLYGSAICAQIHLLWLARAAASMVTLSTMVHVPSIASLARSLLVKMHLLKASPGSPGAGVRARRLSADGASIAEAVVQGQPVPVAIRLRDTEKSREAQAQRQARKVLRREIMARGVAIVEQQAQVDASPQASEEEIQEREQRAAAELAASLAQEHETLEATRHDLPPEVQKFSHASELSFSEDPLLRSQQDE